MTRSLKQMREELNLSQSQLKDTLNSRLNRSYDRHTVSRWENGKQPVPAEVLQELKLLSNREQRQTTIIAFANQKGGVGKTTSSLYLAASISRLGFRVLLVDVDPQASSTAAIIGSRIVELYHAGKTLPHALLKDELLKDCIVGKGVIGEGGQQCVVPFDFIPSHIELSEIDARREPGSDGLFKAALSSIKENYDFIILDLPPNLGFLTWMALSVTDMVFVPVRPEPIDIMGVNLILDTINRVRRRGSNPRLRLGGILPTQFNKSHWVDVDVIRNLVDNLPDIPVLNPISNSTAFGNATWTSKAIETNSRIPAIKSYHSLAEAISESRPLLLARDAEWFPRSVEA